MNVFCWKTNTYTKRKYYVNFLNICNEITLQYCMCRIITEENCRLYHKFLYYVSDKYLWKLESSLKRLSSDEKIHTSIGIILELFKKSIWSSKLSAGNSSISFLRIELSTGKNAPKCRFSSFTNLLQVLIGNP